ncbi:F-box only protein 3-like [Diadema setosum]|uniref:F-box only protein 3-like n=1 Tax=Diadema setosum TaxID=31175 RepID=UPI003B3B0A06
MATASSMLELPDELLIKILDHLDVRFLVGSVSCVCQRLRHLSDSEHLWKKFCAQIWLDEEKKMCEDSWKANFLAWHEKWGPYMDCYAGVKAQWNRIEAALAERCPTTLSHLCGPVDKTLLQQACSMGESPLPPEVCCSFLIHNGQRVLLGQGSLLGTLEVYDHFSMEVAVPLGFSLKNSMPMRGNLMLSWCPYMNYGQALCLRSKPGLERGCVYYLNDVGKPRRQEGYFIMAGSFIEWLEKLADRLSDPELIVHRSKILRFYHEPTCVAVTRDVKVTVATAFVPRMSQVRADKMRTLFAYRISMTMDENAPSASTCKLQSRYWKITDSVGECHEVKGEAVIGLYPVIKPGTNFSYASWTPFDCEGGFMEGHFTFVNLKSGETYDVICPRFNMWCPQVSRAIGGEGTSEEVDYDEDDDEDYSEDEDDDEY